MAEKSFLTNEIFFDCVNVWVKMGIFHYWLKNLYFSGVYSVTDYASLFGIGQANLS